MKKIEISENDRIFATGVYLKPEKVIINNREQWRWIAVGFEDDSYFDGSCIVVNEFANEFDGLVISENDNQRTRL